MGGPTPCTVVAAVHGMCLAHAGHLLSQGGCRKEGGIERWSDRKRGDLASIWLDQPRELIHSDLSLEDVCG